MENPNKLIYGSQPGFPLSAMGRDQVQEAAEFLSDIHIDLVISSPLERAIETATIVAESKNIPVITNSLLGETGLGKIEGVITREEYIAQLAKHQAAQIAEEEGMESPSNIQARMRTAFDQAIQQHPDANILFVSHGAPLCFLMQSLVGEPATFSSGPFYLKKGSIAEVNLNEPVSIKTIFEPHEKS